MDCRPAQSGLQHFATKNPHSARRQRHRQATPLVLGYDIILRWPQKESEDSSPDQMSNNQNSPHLEGGRSRHLPRVGRRGKGADGAGGDARRRNKLDHRDSHCLVLESTAKQSTITRTSSNANGSMMWEVCGWGGRGVKRTKQDFARSTERR